MRFTDMFLAFPGPDPGDRDRRVTRPGASLDDGRTGDRLLALVRPSGTRPNLVHPRARLRRGSGEHWHSGPRLLARHILPNAVSVVIIQLTLDVGYAILATSSLSFIGLGAQPPSPEWGTMMSTARNYFRDAWWYTTFPVSP